MSLLRRTVAVLGVLLAVTTALVTGLWLSPDRSSDPPVRLTSQHLATGWSCEHLRDWYVGHALRQVTAWGWQGPPIYAGVGIPDTAGTQPAADTRSPLNTATTSATGTNVQETGVDEPDTVKTEGGLLVRVDVGRLLTYDVSGPRPRPLGSVDLTGISNPQLLLSGGRVVVLGTQVDGPAAGYTLGAPPAHTWVRTFDVSDPGHPVEVDSRTYDGRLVTARQTGDVIRLVLSDWLPALDFRRPSPKLSDTAALAHNRAVVRGSSITDWLPSVSSADGATPLVDCSHVAVPDTFGGLGTMTVVGFRADAPGTTSATAVATGSDVAYMSPGHLYVTTLRRPTFTGCCMQPLGAPRETVPAFRPDTQVYAFDLAGLSARYVGAGSVKGLVANSTWMDEYDGVLRLAVGSDDGSANAVVLLRPGDGRLVEVGRLEGLGRGQQIRSMRWFDGLAVMVTFRQVDPFYLLDLTDPTHPQVAGVLHLPGWSSYLHPVGPHLILGLGQTVPRPWPIIRAPVPLPPPRRVPSPTLPPDPSLPPLPVPTIKPMPEASATVSSGHAVRVPPLPAERAKATLFDISDPAHPQAVGTVRYPSGSLAQAGLDPHQVTWLPTTSTLLTVVTRGYGSIARTWISVLTVDGDSLQDRLLPVPGAVDVAAVRTVPLDDGRVVLVAGDVVRVLSL